MDRTVRMKVYIPYVLRIPSGCAWKDLGTDYGVYFFFCFHGVASPKTELRMTFYERLCLGYSRFVHPDGPVLWSRHDYGNNVHNSTIYSLKKTRLSTKTKNQMHNL